MRRPPARLTRALGTVLAAIGVLSCTDNATAPKGMSPSPSALTDVTPAGPALVLSQIYGGGGNSGSVYKNDFIEVFNPGTTAVSVAGWSVQYASATGTSWQVTALAGSIPAGGYYLVQEAAGSGGTTSLPTADATGSINMSGTAGKVVLASQSTAIASGTSCPTGATIIDVVSFGTGNCGNPAPAPSSAAQSDQRANSGCTWTGNPTADFALAATNPRNSATAPHGCTVAAAPPATVIVAPDSNGVLVGATATFTASANDASGNPTTTTFTWTSSDPTVATVDANGVATGVAAGLVTITATAANGVTGTAKFSVTAGSTVVNHAGDIVISQIYGGGGNAGSTYKNDFVELFNRSTQPVNVSGWSVQYASATGSFTQATPLSGLIPAGGYFLVQESAGTGGTVDLPTPDATGTISMGAAAGKILLIQSATPAGAACPTGVAVVDEVSFGSGTNCGTSTPAPSATASAVRRSGGCFYTPDAATDFNTGAVAPRNGSSPFHSCVVGALDHVTVAGQKAVLVGATTQLTATPLDANDNIVPGTNLTWASSDQTLATVNATGLVSGVQATGDSVTITVTAVSGAVTKTATYNIKVNTDGINWIDISSSSASFPPGFQTQLFATARVQSGGTVIPATFTFDAVDPQYATVATVQGTGIVTGVAAPTDGSKPGIRVTATPTAGGTPYSFITHPVTIETPVSAPTSVYANNDEFGDPTAADPSSPNDLLIRRAQYVLSYNESRGTPNWVSYELDARQLVTGQDRCNCFTADPNLPPEKQIFTSDYTSGGFDRGHMTRSADRTLDNVDNAITFYLTNVVPQQADLNQGVWAQFENALADSARAGRAVYIIVGPLYSRSHPLSFVKNEGKIAIPDSTWKIALIGPGNSGNPFTRANVQSWSDLSNLTVLAVNMPNIAGVRNDPWSKYLTTVDAIETATGYDFLSLLQTGYQAALDYHDHAPVAAFTTTGGGSEGTPITFDASTSTDVDVGRADLGGRTEALTYTWHFSDESDATGKVVTHTFGHGSYTATLTVTDAFGWPTSTTQTVSLANLPPTATFAAPATGFEGTAFTVTMTGGTDPSPSDAASLRYAFDCGTGYGTPSPAASATCTGADQGDLTVRGKVVDPGDAFTEYSSVIHLANVPPTATFAAPASIGRGRAIALALNGATDASSADVAAGFGFSFDCGAGAGYSAPSTTSTASCPTSASGTRTVHGKVIDKDGGATDYTAIVTIVAVPPTATLNAPSVDTVGTPFTLSLTSPTAATPADLATLHYAFDCGTGYAAPTTTATATCTPVEVRDITVRGKVIDGEGAFTEYTGFVHVPAPIITAALVRHAPQLNSRVEGSLEMLTGENVTFNGNSSVTGKLYVPGLPTVRRNGNPTLGATVDGYGSTSPSNYTVTMNGGTTLGTLVRRTDPTALPSVAAPAAPTGTRSVSLNNSSDVVGTWSTVRNLSLNGNVPAVTIPAGAYGDITVNGSNKIILGVAGATTPSVYDLQHLTLNGSSSVQVVGPVILTVGNAIALNGSLNAGGVPEWLTLRLSQGGLTLNGSVTAAAIVIAPNGTVTVNGGTLTGALAADGLVMNGNGVLKITSSVPTP